jgi:hypothetical protein
MNLFKPILGLTCATSLAAFACERHEPLSEEIREERAETPADTFAPLREPVRDYGASAEDVSLTEAVGLAVASEALGEFHAAQHELQLACIALQDSLAQARQASDVEWSDARRRAALSLQRLEQALSAVDADMQRSPEVKGSTPEIKDAPRARPGEPSPRAPQPTQPSGERSPE